MLCMYFISRANKKVQDFSGVHEIARKLNTSEASGLSGEKSDLEHRQDVFGSNTIPPKPPKTFLEVMIST